MLGIAVLVLWQFFGFSFLGFYRWYDPPRGQIFVDSPEVYTRERLINERSSEEAWLNDKLVQADSKESLTGIMNLIERELNIGERQNPPPSPPPAETTPPQSTSARQQGAADTASSQYLSFDQIVRIESANRDLIMQKIIENRLDDRHDLDGNSLYILKFDTTVVANDYSKRRAIVRIGLYPPIAIAPAANGESEQVRLYSRNLFLPSLDALMSENNTLSFMRASFERFLRDSTNRLNTAISKTISKEQLGKDNLQAIKEIAAHEFGVDVNEVSIKVQKSRERGAPAGAWERYLLNIGVLDNFISFIAGQPTQGLFQPWKFAAQEQKINFEILEHQCQRTDEAIAARDNLKSHTDLELMNGPLSAYFGAGTEAADRKVHLYSGFDGYLLQDQAIHRDFERLLALTIGSSAQPGAYLRSDLLTLRFYEQPLTTEIDGTQFQSASRTVCRSVNGALRTGLMNFVQRVSRFNQYTYSVLPKQSPVAIIDDVIETISSRVSGNSASFNLGFLSRMKSKGARLQSRVTSFGDMSATLDEDGGDLKVGWIIDPLAGRTSHPEDRMISTVDSVMAIVSVPSWWPSIDVRIERGWLEPDGRETPIARDDSETAAKENSRNQNTQTINLPSSQHTLESTLINNYWRRPSIETVSCEIRKVAKPDQKEAIDNVPTCIVSGTRLWRNPIVLLGAVRHKSLNVMPNMNGLLVEFPSDANPCGSTLSVWTSEGTAEKSTSPAGTGCQAAPAPNANASNGGH